MKQDTDFLRGWKEIQAYLKMSRNSIIRYGYPVHCESDNDKTMVFAIKSQLIEWAKIKPLIKKKSVQIDRD